jgi:hypothetical protein
MSTPRLVAKLIKVGYEEETLGDMSRERMIEEWAECVSAGKDQPDPVAAEITFRPTVAMADAEMQKQWIALEQQRLAFERLKYEQEIELKNKEIVLKQQEMEILARKDKDERERKDKLASQMKYFHVAMKNSFSKFPHDPVELPAFSIMLKIYLQCTRYLTVCEDLCCRLSSRIRRRLSSYVYRVSSWMIMNNSKRSY